MKKILSAFALTTFVAGSAYVIWQHALSDRDREAIGKTMSSIQGLAAEALNGLGATLEDMKESTERPDDSNRNNTQRQWRELGF